MIDKGLTSKEAIAMIILLSMVFMIGYIATEIYQLIGSWYALLFIVGWSLALVIIMAIIQEMIGIDR